jgi:carbon starvation protein
MIFVPLLLFAVWLGVRHPIDLSASFMNYALERNPQFAVSDKDREAMLTAIDAETEFVLPDRERTEDALNTAREAAADMLRAGTAAKSTDAEQIRIALNLAVGAFVHTGNPTIDPLILKECAVRIQKRAFKSLTNSDKTANRTWILFLLAYGCLASILPVWLLLQPRDYLNSYLLFAMMLLGFVGILFFQPEIRIPFLAGWTAVNPAGKTDFLFPLLFVTVACGACSGFHALVASGTTSKQIRSEGHILRIGYGSMLVEGLLAVMALISVAYLPLTGYADAIRTLGPTGAFAAGLAQFTTKIGVPFDNAATFVSLAISAFMLTTLDTAMRLARFTWQELFLPRNLSKEGDAAQSVPERTGIPGLLSRPIPATAIAVALSGYLALSGNANQIWPVFGASNQLLAALTLLAITLLLIRKGKNWLTAFLPMAFMMMVSGIALIVLFVQKIKAPPEKRELLLIVATGFLIIMAATLVIRSLLSLTKGREKTSELPASNNLN